MNLPQIFGRIPWKIDRQILKLLRQQNNTRGEKNMTLRSSFKWFLATRKEGEHRGLSGSICRGFRIWEGPHSH